MTRLLITGIGGFTGRHVVDFARDGELELFGLGHAECSPRHGVARQYVVCLSDIEGLKQVVRDVRPDMVMHLAGAAFVGSRDFETFYRTNLMGTRNLLEALASVDYSPRSVLIASSANVYGNLQPGEISESMEPDPANDYGVSKLAMEFMARMLARSLPIIITRPFNYTGVGQSSEFLIPKIIDHLKRRERWIQLGNIDIARDFSDVRDVVRAYMELLCNPAAIGQTVNVCSGRAYQLRETLAIAQELSGHKLKVGVDPALVRANEIVALWGDRTKLNGLLADSSIRPLSDTIAWMLGS